MAGKRGQPTKFNTDYIDQGYELALLGFTDEQLAAFWKVHVDTIYEWYKVHPDFSEAVRAGKTIADGKVARSFFQRATGYDQPSEKVFCTRHGDIVRAETTTHIPADPGAALNWLKNRQPELWRDKVVQEHELPEGAVGGAFAIINLHGKPESA